MGAYLSKPATEKKSSDFSNKRFSYGVSGMQGWRVSMEDAHNCIPDLDEDSSLFAVYDGHGGNEVALYCAYHFGDVLKENESYKNSSFETALTETFLKLDEMVAQKETLLELKVLADRTLEDGPPTQEDFQKKADEEVPDNETELLHEEATMSIEELLKRYGQTANAMNAALAKSASGAEETTPTSSVQDKESEKIPEEGSSGSSSKEVSSPKSSSSSGSKPNVEEKTNYTVTSDIKSDIPGKKEITSLIASATKVKDNEEENVESGKGKETKSKVMKKVKEKMKPAVLATPDEDYKPPHDSDSESEESFDSSEAVGGSEDESSEEEEEEEEDDISPDANMIDGTNTVEEPGKDSGTTAVVALIKNKRLIVANAGDSRCVLSRAEGVAFDMSDDHKPENELELGRIKEAGGHVNAQGRVNGGLNLSRAIGDHCYKTNDKFHLKDQMISALPDIRSIDLRETDEFLVLACDGIWNVLSSQEVIDFVRCRLITKNKENKEVKLSKICEELFTRCLAEDTMGDGTGCDNMTCIIVKFNKEWLKQQNRNGALGDRQDVIENKKTEDKSYNDENNDVNNTFAMKRNKCTEDVKSEENAPLVENPNKRAKYV